MFGQYLRVITIPFGGTIAPWSRPYKFRGTFEKVKHRGEVRWGLKSKSGKITAIALNVLSVAHRAGISPSEKLGRVVVLEGIITKHIPGEPPVIWVTKIY